MYKLSIENLKPGMRIGKNIYNAEGQLLLSEGTLLTRKFILYLNRLQIPSVYIVSDLPAFTIEYPNELLSEKTRVDAIHTVNKAFRKYTITRSLDIPSIQSMVEDIIRSIISKKNTLVQISNIRKHDDYTFAHSVNVCVLSITLARLSDYGPKRLCELAVGALLHDIGKALIPLSILNKNGPLATDEMEVMQGHSEIGFEMLRRTHAFSVVPMHIAYQHHEKFDGSGYPRHLKGEQIHEYARIVAIADVYDALTSDRPYKRACTPDIAYKIMTEHSPGHFDPVLLERFFENIAIYPIGTTVQLNQGYHAIVINVQKGFTHRPSLRLIADQSMRSINHPSVINLKDFKEDDMYIEKVLTEEELLALLAIFENE